MCRPEMQFVDRSPAAKNQPFGNLGLPEHFDQGSADDQVLFDLSICRPRRLLPPFGHEGGRDQSSASTVVLTATRQRRSLGVPRMGAAGARGVTVGALFATKA